MTDTQTPAVDYTAKIAGELNIRADQVQATVALLDDAATVPFIARYRKEATGGLDEVAIIAIRDRVEQLRALDKRREAILKSLEEQGQLTDELKAKVLAAETMAVLEDIYLPYRPKRRTRATIAKERGLEPLAALIFEQGDTDPVAEAAKFVDAEKEVASAEEALAGARDIIAEWVNEDAAARAELRTLFAEKALMKCKVVAGQEQKGSKFRDYFDWSEPIAKAPSHRILAVRRGAEEGVLTFSIQPDETEAVGMLTRRFVKGDGAASAHVREAVVDGYKRLMSLSLETEIRLEAKKRADQDAVRVFAENFRELLMTSPLGEKAVLAVDPGLRTGCKVVCMDKQGKLLHNAVIYPLEPKNDVEGAAATLKTLVEQHHIEAIAIGNGTGGREALSFCRSIDFARELLIEMVNESGASVYSASKVAREEFPDQDVTVRGAVSIGRRLMDPLAELVKIDPKSIGVGQYQHDVDQKLLKQGLDDVVVSCVNRVGVEANTASKQLLSYVSGLGPKLAGSIVEHRDTHGAFTARQALLEVPGMGPKTFEQAGGFLRIRNGENPLDASAVHPESYAIVEQMARDLGCTVADLMQKEDLRQQVNIDQYVTDSVGLPTLTDIMEELAKPGRDPRSKFEPFSFAEGVTQISDLKPGMKLPGIVTNVTDFGAFVDIGVHHDGLLHVSQLSDGYVKRPAEVIKVHQRVMVTVLEIDEERRRVSLSLRSSQEPKGGGRRRERTPSAEPGQPKPNEGRASQPRGPRPSRGEKRGERRDDRRGRPPRSGRQAKAPKNFSTRDRSKPFNNPFVDFFKNRDVKGGAEGDGES